MATLPGPLIGNDNKSSPERGLGALQGDPFKTLFVGRISFDATEKKLRREFEEYGPVKSIRLVHEKRSGDGVLQAASHLHVATGQGHATCCGSMVCTIQDAGASPEGVIPFQSEAR